MPPITRSHSHFTRWPFYLLLAYGTPCALVENPLTKLRHGTLRDCLWHHNISQPSIT
jgi:hypothetical protein